MFKWFLNNIKVIILFFFLVFLFLLGGCKRNSTMHNSDKIVPVHYGDQGSPGDDVP